MDENSLSHIKIEVPIQEGKNREWGSMHRPCAYVLGMPNRERSEIGNSGQGVTRWQR